VEGGQEYDWQEYGMGFCRAKGHGKKTGRRMKSSPKKMTEKSKVMSYFPFFPNAQVA
jgi:hypothetical protein